MLNKNFWMLMLCFFLIIASATELTIPLRIAIGASGLIILMNVILDIRKHLKGE